VLRWFWVLRFLFQRVLFILCFSQYRFPLDRFLPSVFCYVYLGWCASFWCGSCSRRRLVGRWSCCSVGWCLFGLLVVFCTSALFFVLFLLFRLGVWRLCLF
jgi:hypothetical protein